MTFPRILLAGLVGAVMVHILTILLLPRVGGADVIAAFESLGPEGRFAALPQPSPGGPAAPYLDPDFAYSVCRIAPAAGPVRVTANLTAELWSVAVYDRRGANLFSINDQTAGRSALDLLILTPEDLIRLQREGGAILEEAVIVDLPIEAGLVVIRAFYRDPTMLEPTRAMLASANCAGA